MRPSTPARRWCQTVIEGSHSTPCTYDALTEKNDGCSVEPNSYNSGFDAQRSCPESATWGLGNPKTLLNPDGAEPFQAPEKAKKTRDHGPRGNRPPRRV